MDDTTVTFGDLAITILSVFHLDEDPALWHLARVRLQADIRPFHADITTTIFVSQLVDLYYLLGLLDAQVGQAADATCELRHDGAYAELVFALDRLGGLRLSAKLYDAPDYSACLAFDLDFDQSYLRLWAKQLRDALLYFLPTIPQL